MKKVKIIAWYLPQYHSIPENDLFWGKGFTDWVTVKNAKPQFAGHRQPKVPLNNNYYDLSEKDSILWQAKLAREHGIFGFGIYHYWFNNDKNLLTKPSEIILENKDIDINYFFSWDNASWKRSWSNVYGNAWAPISDSQGSNNGSNGILIPYILGTEQDWENHFNAVKNHFADDRYIKVENKPVFVILQYNDQIAKMCHYWDTLAKDEGFNGMYFIFKNNEWCHFEDGFHTFNYEPHHHGWMYLSRRDKWMQKLSSFFIKENQPEIYSFNHIWKRIIKSAKTESNNTFLGGFVSYDDTPRRGKKGKIVKGENPKIFKKYLKELIRISELQDKEFVFLTAWNEWGEGAYFEPDTIYKKAYLEIIKEVTNYK